MGAAMYDGMSAGAPPSPAVARGVALHKVSRLLTYALAADAYLNFVGNEFGHPEWVELPTGDNGHSFHHARRRWRSARRRPRAVV
jgi:1,4-alpha-glucan branching enzyme